MHPRQPFVGQFRRRDFGDMAIVFGKYPERGESISMQGMLGSNGLLGKSLDGILIYPTNRLNGDLCPRGYKARLAVIVQFDSAFQTVQAILIAHRSPLFPQHSLGGDPRHADQLGQA